MGFNSAFKGLTLFKVSSRPERIARNGFTKGLAALSVCSNVSKFLHFQECLSFGNVKRPNYVNCCRNWNSFIRISADSEKL